MAQLTVSAMLTATASVIATCFHRNFSTTSPVSPPASLDLMPCIDAGFIKPSSWVWMEGFAVACQLAPTVPHLLSGACPSPRTCVPRFLQTPLHGDALARPLSCGSTYTWTGDLHPRAWQHARPTRPR